MKPVLSLKQVSDTEFEGMKLLGTFCYNPQAVFPIYFVMRVNKQPASSGYWKKQRPMTEWKLNGIPTTDATNFIPVIVGK